jgi:hypothetical protein
MCRTAPAASPPTAIAPDDVRLTSREMRMATRSKPVQVKMVRCRRTAQITFRVTGSIRGRQRCVFRGDADEAQSIADAWESERINNQAAIRARATRLNQTQLSEAEAIFTLCGSLGLSPMNAVMLGARHAPQNRTKKLFEEALGEFLAEKEALISSSQMENYRLIGTRFGKFIGATAHLDEVSSEQVTAWLKDHGDIKKRTWNSYRNDLSAIFTWFIARPRQWLTDNPVELVIRFRKKFTSTTPERLSVETCRDLMAFLETEHPEWVCFFAVALFAGVRPDMTDGEMAKFARKVAAEGAEKFYRGGKFHFAADMTKDGRARRTSVSPNLAAWIEKYPLSAAGLNPANYYRYGQIRARFKIPHDGLRHTGYSAFVAKTGSIAEATLEFGNSEGVARDHYLDMMTKAEAGDFYAIWPTERANAAASNEMAALVSN